MHWSNARCRCKSVRLLPSERSGGFFMPFLDRE
nr:MAG TPA: hypothetical protein [Caudoviricetes sp.]DAP87416.1 MAG TPA: hypothetical protein [Caudoviricetes sp.]DAT41075.1 MAG TPA: hypothetical protein [Caudoviricetes sp.]